MSSFINNLNPSGLIPWITNTYKKEPVQKVLFLTGLAFASWNFLKYASRVTSYILTRELNLIGRYGVDSWALITGASDGIGKEFALQLAQRGFNIVLVARNEEKLGVVRSEITTRFPNVRVQIVVADFSKSAEEGFYERILQQVTDLDISLLINNVGIGISEEYHLMPTTDVRNHVIVNCLSQALMTRVFLPKLLARCNDKVRSGVVDISSMAANTPLPYSQVYGATKVFNDFLSQGLAYEYPNLDFLSLKPAYIKSNMTELSGKYNRAITTQQFVSSGLKYLGQARVSYGHWRHQLFATIFELLPSSILNIRMKQLDWESAQHTKLVQKKEQVISEKL